MTQHPALRPGLEGVMYMAFAAAPPPTAWLRVRELLFYRARPELLESRDSAPMVFAAAGAVQIMTFALGLAALPAVYVLVSGPRAARYSCAILLGVWVLSFWLGLRMAGSTPFASMARLYGDAVPFVALCLLPLACAGVRLALRGARSS